MLVDECECDYYVIDCGLGRQGFQSNDFNTVTFVMLLSFLPSLCRCVHFLLCVLGNDGFLCAIRKLKSFD